MLERVTALLSICPPLSFFFNDTATTEIYTLSLHDALPISDAAVPDLPGFHGKLPDPLARRHGDRKSTRLNSSHSQISYAGFCLKKQRIHPHAPRSSGRHVPSTPGAPGRQPR